jgi:HPr kinase/phosphorylase
LLILGPSGSGKSALALQLMAYGCTLVSDDRTIVTPRDGGLFAEAPAAIAGRIEARGVGLLAAEVAGPTRLCLAVDMGRTETDRLPPERHYDVAEYSLPLVHRLESAHFPAAILQYLRCGRVA